MASYIKLASSQLERTLDYYVSALDSLATSFHLSPLKLLRSTAAYYTAHPRHLLPFAPQPTSSSTPCPYIDSSSPSQPSKSSLTLSSSKPLLAEIIHALVLCALLWAIPTLLERRADRVLRETDEQMGLDAVPVPGLGSKVKGLSQVEIDSRRAEYQKENFSDSSDDD